MCKQVIKLTRDVTSTFSAVCLIEGALSFKFYALLKSCWKSCNLVRVCLDSERW